MKNIYLVRHGQSEANADDKTAGGLDSPLTQKGREQANLTGKKLLGLNVNFDLIISSPLSRALDTAKAIADQIGYDKSDINIIENLKERSFGSLEGGPGIIENIVPLDKYLKDPYSLDEYPEVEKIEDLQKRADKAWSEILQIAQENTIVVGHGAFGRALQRAAKGLSLEDPVARQDNADIVKIEI